MFLIQFILTVLFVGIIIVAVAAWQAWRRIHKAVNDFNRQMGGATGNNKQAASTHTTYTDNGDTITDTRGTEQANQKIFSKGEGEYVDYKES